MLNVSLPRFKDTRKFKGFGFIEFAVRCKCCLYLLSRRACTKGEGQGGSNLLDCNVCVGGRDQVKDDIAKAVGKSEYSEEKAREYCVRFFGGMTANLIFCAPSTAKALRVMTKLDWLKLKGK